MSQPNQQILTERDMMDDSISSQKMITSSYNTYANECANNQLRSTFLNILTDEHDIQARIFDEMSARGWYTLKQADQNQIMQTKQKYSNASS